MTGARRRLTAAELDAWRAFMTAQLALLRGVDRDMEEAGAVPLADYGVLVTLHQAPSEGLRLHELADRVGLTKSGLTRLLDRMEERGVVARHSCATDRRGQYASLTPAGRRALRRSAPAHLRSVARRFADALSPRELAVVTEAFARIGGANRAREAGS